VSYFSFRTDAGTGAVWTGVGCTGGLLPRKMVATISTRAEISCTIGFGKASPTFAAAVRAARTICFLVAPGTVDPNAASVPTTNGMMRWKIERNLFTLSSRRERKNIDGRGAPGRPCLKENHQLGYCTEEENHQSKSAGGCCYEGHRDVGRYGSRKESASQRREEVTGRHAC
jgi:hypothetical protein